jgi:hypothetical protein
MAQERGSADASILSGSPHGVAYWRPLVGAAAHDGWFVRVCPAKTEANRMHLAFSGGRQGFSWCWTKGRSPNEIDLPRRFHSVARLTMRGSTTPTASNIQPHASVCVGFGDHIVQRMEFDDHEDHERNGMIPMIVPAKGEHQYLT